MHLHRSYAVVLIVSYSIVAWADGPGDNQAASVRPIPPPGITVPASDRQRLEADLAELAAKLAMLKSSKSPYVKEMLPDVEIFFRAVDQALRYNEMFDPADINRAAALISEGNQRAASLAEQKAPWTLATGLVVRGFRSKLDDTVQPYGLVIPPNYRSGGNDKFRCDLWFHGRGEKSVELQFIAQRMKQVGEYAPENTIVLHPFARYCNANKLAGEVDCLEALAHAKKNYRIDDDRISVRGFSMGGAACWQFAVHYSDQWFAANPGAGFAETREFLRLFQGEEISPLWWEERLYHWYDCTDWVQNLRQCPTIAYSGEIDLQKQAADIMAAAIAKEGGRLTHIIGPNTAHKLHPDSKLIIEAKMASLAEQGRQRFPKEIHWTSYTLKYPQMHWLKVKGLDEHWRKSTVHARWQQPRRQPTLVVSVSNINDFIIEYPAGYAPIGPDPVQVVISEPTGTAELTVPGSETDRSWTQRFHRRDGQWVNGTPADTLRKRPGLQGPIDDALMSAFLFVKPSKADPYKAVDDWVSAELDHAVKHWRQQMRGDVIVKFDHEVTDADIASRNPILWGTPQSNSFIAKVAEQLPIKWHDTSLQIGDQSFNPSFHIPALVYPNPLQPDRYVVLNSSFTYREYHYLNNARQTPKLPDWAIIDIRQPPDAQSPGRVVAADFFDENWQVKPPQAAAK